MPGFYSEDIPEYPEYKEPFAGSWWSPLYVFGIIPLTALADPYFRKYKWKPLNGNKFGLAGLLTLIALMSVDDVGTAIGLQAKERPLDMFEGNPHMVYIWKMLMRWGVKTETAAHRIIWMVLIAEVLLLNYLGYAGPWCRSYLYLMGAIKAYSGSGWWTLKPNKFTMLDFLTFKNGRITPERGSKEMGAEFNSEIGADYTRVRRRRMLHYFFPTV